MLFVVFWEGEAPPNLDIALAEKSVGIHSCKQAYWPRKNKVFKVGQDHYMRSFGNVFGVTAGGVCHEFLNGRQVEVLWLPLKNTNQRLLIQLTDLGAKQIIGNNAETSLIAYKRAIDDKSYLTATKAALLALACLLFFWRDFGKSKSKSKK